VVVTGDLVLLATGAGVAGLVQGISGFAFSMVAMSIWVWGIEPQVGAVMAVFGGLCGQLVAAFSVRRGLHAALLLPLLGGALVGVPLGVLLLPHLDLRLFKLLLGGLLVVWCPLMLVSGRLPRVGRVGRWTDALAGLCGGLMGGLGGFTGVVPTLWYTLRGLAKDEQRALVQNFNLAALAFTFAGYLVGGRITSAMWPLFAVVAPALLLPALLGARIYTGLSDLSFRRIVLLLLTASGLAMILSALRT
jgi:uncharacterized membrane protein YfcA